MMLGWLLVIVALVIVLVRGFERRDQAAPVSDAEQVLATRFARGEVDETEFRARLAVLKERR